MRTMNRRAIRDQLTKQHGDQLPDGVGGTVTGGPREPIDLMAILARAHASSRGGAVSGAAQVVVSSIGAGKVPAKGIALSDGSRISFTTIAEAGVYPDADAGLEPPGEAWESHEGRRRSLADA